MPTSIRLSAKDEDRLAFLAEQTGRSKAFYLRQLIENGLDDLEDYYLAARTCWNECGEAKKKLIPAPRLGAISVLVLRIEHRLEVYR